MSNVNATSFPSSVDTQVSREETKIVCVWRGGGGGMRVCVCVCACVCVRVCLRIRVRACVCVVHSNSVRYTGLRKAYNTAFLVG